MVGPRTVSGGAAWGALVRARSSAGTGWVLLVGDADAVETASAVADATHACDIAERYPDGIDIGSTGVYDEDPTIRLMSALHELTRSAAAEDSSYETLFESAGAVREAFVAYDSDAMGPALDDVRARCSGLGLGGDR